MEKNMEKNNKTSLTNITNKLFYNIFDFFGFLKINKQPVNPAGKYIENYKKNLEFKKFPLVYTNPRWNPLLKKIEFDSLDMEIDRANKRPKPLNPNVLAQYNYWVWIENNKKKQSQSELYKNMIKKYSNPFWDDKLKKLVYK